MERAGPGFFQRVIDTYDHLAAAEPARFLVLDGSRDIDSLQEHIRQDVLAHLSS